MSGPGKGRRIPYSAEELAWIKSRSKDNRRDAHADFVAKFGRADVSLKNFNALCKRRGWMTGRTGQFRKGQEPRNKGVPMSAETRAKAARTWFRKGNLPHTYRGPGHESICSKDGYVWMVVAEKNPHTGADTRRVLKHRWLWEQANGPVPDRHCLKCLDGNPQNTDPSNWECIPRALLPRLAGGRHRRKRYEDYEPEMRPAVLAVAKLEHAAREARKGQQRGSQHDTL